MARKISLALYSAVLIGTTLMVAPVAAQSQRHLEWCMNATDNFPANQRIDGCTAAIQSGNHWGKSLSSAYYNRGIAYFKKGQYDFAIADFDHAIELDPTSSFALNNRGTAYARKGQFERAIAD